MKSKERTQGWSNTLENDCQERCGQQPPTKKGQTTLNKPIMVPEISNLTQKTNPKQTQNRAIKSFIFRVFLGNKPKTKPLNRLRKKGVCHAERSEVPIST
jgi:hypothetical protein